MNRCHTPFFIWFSGRTGSTFLCDLLDSHPDVLCRTEDFTEIRVDNGYSGQNQVYSFGNLKFIRRLFTPGGTVEDPSDSDSLAYMHSIFSSGVASCGFKFKYPTQYAVYPEVMQELMGVEDLRVIELSRENVLKQAVSLRNVPRVQDRDGSQSGNTKGNVELEPIQLDVKMAVGHARYFATKRVEFQSISARFRTVLKVTYEDLLENLEPTLSGILEFLRVDPTVELTSNFKKITPNRLEDAVANYGELVDAVKGTGLEQYLD